MSKTKLFIATTLDGFIARENGSLDWLHSFPNPVQLDYGYHDFLTTVDTIVMGRKTYEEILSFGIDWPYEEFSTYIVTSDENYTTKTNNTYTLSDMDKKAISDLKDKSEKGIWLVGGGTLITSFLNLGAIDEMTLSIIPVILGKGIRLFPNEPKEAQFKLQTNEVFKTGVVNLVYTKMEAE